MKNQNDLIFSIVALVLAFIAGVVWMMTKREPQTIAAPQQVNLAPLQMPTGDIRYADALPGGGQQQGAGPGLGAGAPGGGGGVGSPMAAGVSGAGGAPAAGGGGFNATPSAAGMQGGGGGGGGGGANMQAQ